MNSNNSNNLDDIIIDDDSKPNHKTKNFLTITGLVVIAIFVAIILLQVLTKNQDEEKIPDESNSTVLIAPELTLQPDDIVKEEEIIQEIPLLEPIDESPFDDDLEEEEEIVEEEKIEIVPITKDYSQDKKIETKPAPPKKVEEKVIVQKPKPVLPKTVEKGRYFVQVGSFRETPSSWFLSKIRNSGFNYVITTPNSNGIKKLLIGAYHSRDEANNALTKVKDRINKSAFVIKR